MNQRKSVLITGTSSGIGKASAKHFASHGWNVAATMRSPDKESELNTLPNVKLYKLDVTDGSTIDAAFAAAIADFGRIDVLVNNAGFGVDGVFEAMSDDVIRNQFETNVFGLMRATRAMIPIMRKQGGGTIIQVASMGGRLSFPLFSIYHGTKWAVEGFTESLQYELRPFNIKVRLIEPGAINTEFYGASRVMVGGNLTEYKEIVDKGEAVSQAPKHNAVSPAVVAEAIEKAAVHGGWKLRFPVGAPAPMLLLLRKFLPESWFFFIIKSSYKL